MILVLDPLSRSKVTRRSWSGRSLGQDDVCQSICRLSGWLGDQQVDQVVCRWVGLEIRAISDWSVSGSGRGQNIGLSVSSGSAGRCGTTAVCSVSVGLLLCRRSAEKEPITCESSAQSTPSQNHPVSPTHSRRTFRVKSHPSRQHGNQKYSDSCKNPE